MKEAVRSVLGCPLMYRSEHGSGGGTAGHDLDTTLSGGKTGPLISYQDGSMAVGYRCPSKQERRTYSLMSLSKRDSTPVGRSCQVQ
jgi:hypothetical protein